MYTAAEESERLLVYPDPRLARCDLVVDSQERYRRERHIFTPMEQEKNMRANHESRILEPVK